MSQRINVELPDWVDERNLHILAGIEEVAYKLKDGSWMVKTKRCSMCGECCRQLGSSFIFNRGNGECRHLVKEVGGNDRWLCDLGTMRPHGCCISTPDKDYCSIQYKET